MRIGILWRLTRGYRLRPWNSPYLRWRMETYWGQCADEISFLDFWRFAWNQRRELLRYLRWAERMESAVRSRGTNMPGPSGAARL
ncbi:MAG: hypothetical protein ABSF25_18290 [Bryobacteraceae bacterium]|jgi:hypothetical protein